MQQENGKEWKHKHEQPRHDSNLNVVGVQSRHREEQMRLETKFTGVKKISTGPAPCSFSTAAKWKWF